MKKLKQLFCLSINIYLFFSLGIGPLCSQGDTIVFGFGINENLTVTSSSEAFPGQTENITNNDGFLPNYNAASRFLSHASLGYNIENIESLTQMGYEEWINDQFSKPVKFNLVDKVEEYRIYRRTQGPDPDANSLIRFYDYAWWQYHMSSDDLLRQKIAFALSEILVISRFSAFNSRPHAFSTYYDIFLQNAFGNYRDIMQEVTYHPAMGIYLTYLNNPKTDTTRNQFPDENYAREIMQLFTIGLHELNIDGTEKLNDQNEFIPTYDNQDISEFSKIFTGLTWGDQDRFGRGIIAEDSYIYDMKMFNEYHEPGPKYLLNGYVVPDRNPVDGDADISDALDNLFQHPNMGPFVGKLLIQRLVTSNPSPEYIARVAKAFNDNGAGVRGDMKAVISAILLDPENKDCNNADKIEYGKMREPFARYVQLAKAFDNSTPSGNHRNDLNRVYVYLEQIPNASPSVFNFFQPDYQPIGPVEENDLVAPEFQITNSQTITGYFNGLDRWVLDENIADEYTMFTGELAETYADEFATLDLSDEIALADDAHLEILLDRLNMLLANGNISDVNLDYILNFVKQFPQDDEDDLEYRAKVAIYMVMVCPEYIINK